MSAGSTVSSDCGPGSDFSSGLLSDYFDVNPSENPPHGGEHKAERDAERLRRLMRSEIAHTRASGAASSPTSPRLTERPAATAPEASPTPMSGTRQATGAPWGAAGSRRWRRRLAPTAAILVGSVLALLAYAGGGNLLSSVFGSYSVLPVADTYEALPAPVLLDSLKRDTAAVAPAAIVAAVDTTAAPAAADSAASASDSAATPSDTTALQRPPVVEPPARREVARDSVARRDTVSSSPRRALNGRFIVQVRATADLQQAEALAKKLRRRGLTGVSITESSREGETTYRVRYGSFTTEDEARSSAAEQGLSDVWIVRR